MYLVCLKQDRRKRNSIDDQNQEEMAEFQPCAEQQIWRGVNLCTLPHSLPNLFKKTENWSRQHTRLVRRREQYLPGERDSASQADIVRA